MHMAHQLDGVPTGLNDNKREKKMATQQTVFDPQDWLKSLTTQIGIDQDDIPKPVLEDILTKGSKAWVNRSFFEWYNTRSVDTEFTNADTVLFKKCYSVEQSERYRLITRDISNNRGRIAEHFNQINTYLAKVAELNLQRLELKNKHNLDLTEEIKAIVKDGWYKYASTETHEFNKVNPNDLALIFHTPAITLRSVNQRAGVNLSVDMGKYKVIYRPAKGSIRVRTLENNIATEGYPHPHITGGGDICWGNAQDTFYRAMEELKPSKAFLALRMILQTYNDGSPFAPLSEFYAVRNADRLMQGELVYTRHNQRAWVWDEYLPAILSEDVHESTESDDGDSISLITVYAQVNKATGLRIPGPYFVRDGQDSYIPLDTEALDVWE